VPKILEDVARLSAQLLMHASLEAKITEFLGCDRYQRAASCEDARPTERYREVTVKTTAGSVQVPRAQAAWHDRGVRVPVVRVARDERAGVAGNRSFVRVLPVRDVEAALAEALGDQATISKSTVLAICGEIKREDQASVTRRLDRITLGYLFPGRRSLSDAPRLPGRAGPSRLGYHHRRQAAFIRAPAAASPPAPGTTSSPT
jgi:putative transposase